MEDIHIPKILTQEIRNGIHNIKLKNYETRIGRYGVGKMGHWIKAPDKPKTRMSREENQLSTRYPQTCLHTWHGMLMNIHTHRNKCNKNLGGKADIGKNCKHSELRITAVWF